LGSSAWVNKIQRHRLDLEWLDDEEFERISKGTIEAYSNVLIEIREEIRSRLPTQQEQENVQKVIKAALITLDALIENP
jgi:hypothetical protein